MISTSKTSIFSVEDIGVIVKTPNQSIEDQPCLWLVHGSGGISSNEDLWIQHAFERNITVIIVDSYSNRGIFKQNWTSLEEKRVDPKTRALDQLKAYNFLSENKSIVKFANLLNSKVVGFSDGGTAGIWLQQKDFPDIWTGSYCLYPGLKPTVVPEELYSIRSEKTHIFVGELDNWTPAFYDQDFQKITNCKLTIWPNTHHSFSKPGVAQWHAETLNYKRERGVYCEYSEDSTLKTMEIVFNA